MKSDRATKKRQTLFPPWALVLAFVLAVGTIWLRLHIVGLSYELGQMDQMIRNATQERQKLAIQMTEVRDPKKLEEMARKKFELQPPEAKQIVQFE